MKGSRACDSRLLMGIHFNTVHAVDTGLDVKERKWLGKRRLHWRVVRSSYYMCWKKILRYVPTGTPARMNHNPTLFLPNSWESIKRYMLLGRCWQPVDVELMRSPLQLPRPGVWSHVMQRDSYLASTQVPPKESLGAQGPSVGTSCWDAPIHSRLFDMSSQLLRHSMPMHHNHSDKLFFTLIHLHGQQQRYWQQPHHMQQCHCL